MKTKRPHIGMGDMQLVLIIKNNSYAMPFTINQGSSVSCTFSDSLQDHPLIADTPFKRNRLKRQALIPK